jgi:hypothetical protein
MRNVSIFFLLGCFLMLTVQSVRADVVCSFQQSFITSIVDADTKDLTRQSITSYVNEVTGTTVDEAILEVDSLKLDQGCGFGTGLKFAKNGGVSKFYGNATIPLKNKKTYEAPDVNYAATETPWNLAWVLQPNTKNEVDKINLVPFQPIENPKETENDKAFKLIKNMNLIPQQRFYVERPMAGEVSLCSYVCKNVKAEAMSNRTQVK